jgi:transaldolase
MHRVNFVDGWVLLEVFLSLVCEEEATVREATRLSKFFARPNVFIKVSATSEGIPVVRRFIGSGIFINITLMFNRRHYRDVAHPRELRFRGGRSSKVHSVASFFTRVDRQKLLDEKIAKAAE